MSLKDGPGEGGWAVFAEKVVKERDEARAECEKVKAFVVDTAIQRDEALARVAALEELSKMIVLPTIA